MIPAFHAVTPFIATDPLFPTNNVGLAIFLIVLIKVVVVFAALMVAVMLMIWFERKVISDMQSRIGPNRAGPFGILQTLADGIKFDMEKTTPAEKKDGEAKGKGAGGRGRGDVAKGKGAPRPEAPEDVKVAAKDEPKGETKDAANAEKKDEHR